MFVTTLTDISSIHYLGSTAHQLSEWEFQSHPHPLAFLWFEWTPFPLTKPSFKICLKALTSSGTQEPQLPHPWHGLGAWGKGSRESWPRQFQRLLRDLKQQGRVTVPQRLKGGTPSYVQNWNPRQLREAGCMVCNPCGWKWFWGADSEQQKVFPAWSPASLKDQDQWLVLKQHWGNAGVYP